MASVTILIKTATVVPAFGFDKDKFPSITMGVQQDAEDELSSDSKTEPITCESDGMAFPKPMTLEKLPRGATAQNVTFTFRGNVLGSTLGKSVLGRRPRQARRLCRRAQGAGDRPQALGRSVPAARRH